MGIEINSQSLALLAQAVDTRFKMGLAIAAPTYQSMSMTVPSTGAENVYPALRDMGYIREWIGDRVIQGLAQYDFKIKNKSYEGTWDIRRTLVADDQFNLYGPIFEEAGRLVGIFPDEMMYSLLGQGFTSLGVDGQFFFDTDHPVGRPGAEVSVSNHMGGAGRAWYLLDSKRVVKPLIYQPREPFKLVKLFNPDDPNVFYQDKYVWGVDGRAGAGYSPFWQLMVASKQTLDLANVQAAMTQMASFKNDAGKTLNLEADTLIVGSLDGETARNLVSKEFLSGGESNTLKGRLKVVVSGWV